MLVVGESSLGECAGGMTGVAQLKGPPWNPDDRLRMRSLVPVMEGSRNDGPAATGIRVSPCYAQQTEKWFWSEALK